MASPLPKPVISDYSPKKMKLSRKIELLIRYIFNPNWKENAHRSRKLSQAVTAYMKRSIPEKLTEEVLKNFEPYKIPHAIYDFIERKAELENNDPIKIIKKLPKERVIIKSCV